MFRQSREEKIEFAAGAAKRAVEFCGVVNAAAAKMATGRFEPYLSLSLSGDAAGSMTVQGDLAYETIKTLIPAAEQNRKNAQAFLEAVIRGEADQ